MRKPEEILRDLITDFEAMRSRPPRDLELQEDERDHWLGDFSLGHQNDSGLVFVQWPNLSILIREAREALAPRIEIGGSYGQLIVNAETGAVIREESTYDDDDEYYKNIIGFNLPEHREYWGIPDDKPIGGDILDFGFWYGDPEAPSYQSADNDWRVDCKERLKLEPHGQSRA